MDFAAVKKLVESSMTTTAIKEEDHVVKTTNHAIVCLFLGSTFEKIAA